MRFLIIAERRYLSQRMPAELVRSLRTAGYGAHIICSDDVVCDFRSRVPSFDSYDVAISRDRSLVGLFLLALAEKSGVVVVNSRAAVEGVRNKAEMTATLVAAGIPIPPTVICRNPAQLRSLPGSYFPLVLKPNFGDNGYGIQVVGSQNLSRIEAPDGSVLLAQKYVSNEGSDLKLYVAGEHVWAVSKPNVWSPSKGHDDASAIPITAEMRSVALRCGKAFGLEVYGVDALPTPNGIRVIEVNEFPNFTGVDDAPRVVADLLIARARACMAGGSQRSHLARRGTGSR